MTSKKVLDLNCERAQKVLKLPSYLDGLSLKIFIQSFPLPVIVFDKNLHFFAASKRFFDQSPLEEDRIVGHPHWYELVTDMPKKWKSIHQRCLKGEYLKCEADPFYRADGTVEWWKWEISPWRGDKKEIQGVILYVENVTRQKRLIGKLKQSIKTLNQSNQDLSKFAHICAHDLREPLRTIYSYIEFIQEKIGDREDLAEYMKHIKTSALYISNLVKDMLRYAEMDATSFNFKDVNLTKVVDNVGVMLRKEIAEKNAIISYENLPVVYGDEILLNQLIQNLLGNSLKYSGGKAPFIQIKARELKRAWIISIEDNGIGIESHYFKTIFELFERLHAKSEYEGSGLGLAQCKRIIEIHKGKIWVRSEVNKGSTFHFLLPKKEPPQ